MWERWKWKKDGGRRFLRLDFKRHKVFRCLQLSPQGVLINNNRKNRNTTLIILGWGHQFNKGTQVTPWGGHPVTSVLLLPEMHKYTQPWERSDQHPASSALLTAHHGQGRTGRTGALVQIKGRKRQGRWTHSWSGAEPGQGDTDMIWLQSAD